MKWRASVGLHLTIDYDDIEANSREEAEDIARERAVEDIDFNNAVFDENYDTTIYCCFSDDEEEREG